jgi:hypothetical protein
MNEFIREANNVLKYFKTKPQISGKNDFIIDEIEYLQENIIEGVHHLKNKGDSYIVMGNIRYPLKVREQFKEYSHLIDYASLEFNFPIGALDVSASREELSYDSNTIKSIIEMFEKLESHLKVVLDDELKPLTKWNQIKRIKYHEKHFTKAAKNYTVDDTFNVDRRIIGETFNVKFAEYSKDRNSSTIKRNSSEIISPYNKETIFIVNMSKVGIENKIREYYKHKPQSLLIYSISPLFNDKPFLWEKFLDSLGNPDYITSDIFKTEVVKAILKPVEKSVFKYYELSQSLYKGNYTLTWGNTYKTILDDKKEYCYVVSSNKRATVNGTDVKDIYSWLKHDCGFNFYINIALIQPSNEQHIKNLPNWKPVGEVIEQYVNDISEQNLNIIALNYIKGKYNYLQYMKHPSITNLVFDLINDITTVTYQRVTLSSFEKLCKVFNSNKINELNTIITKYESIINKYPLLKMIRKTYFTNDDYCDIVNYIKMIDGDTSE